MYHKIQDPISNSIFKTKSTDGKQLVQKYIYQYNIQSVKRIFANVISGVTNPKQKGGASQDNTKAEANAQYFLKEFKSTNGTNKILNIKLLKSIYDDLYTHIDSLNNSDYIALVAAVENMDSFSTVDADDGSEFMMKLSVLTTLVKTFIQPDDEEMPTAKDHLKLTRRHRFKEVIPIKKKGTFSCLNDYKFVKDLGQGAWAQVFLVKKGKSNQLYAMKEQVVAGENTLKRMGRELQISTLMGTHNLGPEIYDSFLCKTIDANGETVTKVYIIMSHMNRGGLRDFSQENLVNDDFLESLKNKIQKMHDLNILHQDLHMANVLVNEESGIFVPYIADFGLSKSFEEHGEEATKWEQTPEFINQLKWTQKSLLIERIIILSGLV